jgi:DNA-binding MarR family transcriptional regulator
MGHLSKGEYEALLTFRVALRGFLRFTEEGARAVGLTPQQHQVLLAIMGQKGRDQASVGEIASALYISHHAAVGLVNRCQAAGLVTRSHDEPDRRTVMVSPTAHARELLGRLSAANLTELHLLSHALATALKDTMITPRESIDLEG